MTNVVNITPRSKFKEQMSLADALSAGVKMVLTLETCCEDKPLNEMVFIIALQGGGYGFYGLDHNTGILVCDATIEQPEWNSKHTHGEIVFSVAQSVYADARNIKLFADDPINCIYQY